MGQSPIKILYDKLLEIVKCPIQQSIMNDVVMAEDGHFYEKSALEKWLVEKNVSPITNQPIANEILTVHPIKSLIDILFEYNPALKEEQFLPEKTDHINCEKEIYKHLGKGTYQALLKYQKFSLPKFVGDTGQYEDTFLEFLSSAPMNVLTYVFENMENLEELTYDKCKLVHLICLSGRSDMVKYLVDKRVKFEDKNKLFKKPIHYAVKYCNFEAVKYILDKINVNLDDKDKDKNYPVHYLLNNDNMKSSEKIILLDKFVNFNYPNNERKYPIHLVCEKGDIELVKYFIKRKINLECEDDNGWRPIHYICKNPTLISCLESLVEQGVDLNCETNEGKKPIHFLAKPSTLELVKYLIDKGATVENWEDDNMCRGKKGKRCVISDSDDE